MRWHRQAGRRYVPRPFRGEGEEKLVDSEQVVRAELAKQWSTFAPADKTSCVNDSRMGGESSYTELLTCLEMARDVRSMHTEGEGKGRSKAAAPAPTPTPPGAAGSPTVIRPK